MALVAQIPQLKIVNPAIAEADARRVCSYLQDGHSRADANANASVLAKRPSLLRPGKPRPSWARTVAAHCRNLQWGKGNKIGLGSV